MGKHVGKEQIIEVDGKRYTLARIDRAMMKEFADWALAQLPDPLDLIAAKLNQFPKELHNAMVKEAMKQSRLRADFTSAEVQSVLASPDGIIKMMVLQLRQHHPSITEEEAWQVATELMEDKGEDFRSGGATQV